MNIIMSLFTYIQPRVVHVFLLFYQHHQSCVVWCGNTVALGDYTSRQLIASIFLPATSSQCSPPFHPASWQLLFSELFEVNLGLNGVFSVQVLMAIFDLVDDTTLVSKV